LLLIDEALRFTHLLMIKDKVGAHASAATTGFNHVLHQRRKIHVVQGDFADSLDAQVCSLVPHTLPQARLSILDDKRASERVW